MDPARQQRSYADLRKLTIQLAAAEGLVGTHTYHLKKYKNLPFKILLRIRCI